MGYDSEQVAHLPVWSLLNEYTRPLMTLSACVVPLEDPKLCKLSFGLLETGSEQ